MICQVISLAVDSLLRNYEGIGSCFITLRNPHGYISITPEWGPEAGTNNYEPKTRKWQSQPVDKHCGSW